jgi:hypothetical protein
VRAASCVHAACSAYAKWPGLPRVRRRATAAALAREGPPRRRTGFSQRGTVCDAGYSVRSVGRCGCAHGCLRAHCYPCSAWVCAVRCTGDAACRVRSRMAHGATACGRSENSLRPRDRRRLLRTVRFAQRWYLAARRKRPSHRQPARKPAIATGAPHCNSR